MVSLTTEKKKTTTKKKGSTNKKTTTKKKEPRVPERSRKKLSFRDFFIRHKDLSRTQVARVKFSYGDHFYFLEEWEEILEKELNQ